MPDRPYAITFGTLLLGLALLALLAFLALGQIPSGTASPQTLQDLGTLFSGLTLLAALGMHRGSRRRIRRTEGRPQDLGSWMAGLGSWASLGMVPLLAGLAYHALGGQHPATARYARTFLVLAPLMFVATVPWPKRSQAPHGPQENPILEP